MELEYESTINFFGRGIDQPISESESLVGRVVWRDAHRYASYHFQGVSAYSPESKQGLIQSGLNVPTEFIQTSRFYSRYMKHIPACVYQTKNLESVTSMLAVHALNPQVCWCNSHPPYEMAGHLKELRRFEDNPKDVTTVTPVKSHPRRFQILRDSGYEYRTGFLVDLDQGGMVIENWIHYPLDAKNDWIFATYDWAQDPHGVSYVSKWTNIEHDPKDREKVKIRQEARIQNFNSQPKIPTNRFDFSSLKLAKGTRLVKIEIGRAHV